MKTNIQKAHKESKKKIHKTKSAEIFTFTQLVNKQGKMWVKKLAQIPN